MNLAADYEQLLERAESFRNRGQHIQAIAELNQILSLQHESFPFQRKIAGLLLGHFLCDIEEYREARRKLQDITQIGTDICLLELQAGLARRVRKYNLALSTYSKLLAIEEYDCNIAYRARAMIWINKGVFRRAFNDLTRVIASDDVDEMVKALLQRGRLHLMLKRIPQAIADANQVLQLEPSHLGARALFGSCLIRTGDHQQCKSLLTQIASVQDHLEVDFFRAELHEFEDQYSAALNIYSKILQRPRRDHVPNYSFDILFAARQRRADIYSDRGHRELAIQDLNLLIAAAGDESEEAQIAELLCQRSLQICHLKSNQALSRVDSNKAVLDLTGAIRKEPNMAAAYAIRGWIRSRNEPQLKRLALNDLTMAIDLGLKCADLYMKRAQLNLSCGKIDEGAEDLNRAIEADPDNAEAWSMRGEIAIAAGNYKQAIPAYETALRRGNGNMKYKKQLGEARSLLRSALSS